MGKLLFLDYLIMIVGFIQVERYSAGLNYFKMFKYFNIISFEYFDSNRYCKAWELKINGDLDNFNWDLLFNTTGVNVIM